MALETLYENDYASGDGQSPAKQLRLVVNIHHPPAFAIVIQFDLRFGSVIPSISKGCDIITVLYSPNFWSINPWQQLVFFLNPCLSWVLWVGDGVFPPCYRWATVVLPAQFGEQVGDSCGIQFHSLHPHMESCKAGRNGVFKGGSFFECPEGIEKKKVHLFFSAVGLGRCFLNF